MLQPDLFPNLAASAPAPIITGDIVTIRLYQDDLSIIIGQDQVRTIIGNEFYTAILCVDSTHLDIG